MQEILGVALIVVTLAGITMGVFFFLRSIPRYQNWRDGEKDELWMFISFLCGGLSGILLGMGYWIMVVGESYATYQIIPLGIILGLGAIALATVYIILKWKDANEGWKTDEDLQTKLNSLVFNSMTLIEKDGKETNKIIRAISKNTHLTQEIKDEYK